ncbi:DoxX family protein [Streptomyces sp. R1]|uniref:DoxX family protein n=1 Tax=Streptomyces TaxID=1883 RepID=UPI001E5250BB|nr:DoxX family protein [Streptomyces sp. R1]MCC8340552.1 DoxX family protein [Streptomyces sp. R1]MDA4888086.1 DoxX family protein [Streptomyces sp. MS2A]
MMDNPLALLVVTLLTAALNIGIAAADLAGARFVLANSAEVGVPRSWLSRLAALKLAGAAGLLLGLQDTALRPLGAVAACGLVLFYLGALAFHVRARVLHNLAFPGFFLATAVAALALTVLS